LIKRHSNYSFFIIHASDDVKPNKFEIAVEIYSYELFNNANNILQSARKLAKQFTEFATFKRNTHQQAQQINSNLNGANSLQNANNSYSQSMHKFKLIAKATLTQEDLSESVETKNLKIVNDSGKFFYCM
jgi:DNA anti-recombination protein RmuC